MDLSAKRVRSFVMNRPTAENARSASMEVGGILLSASNSLLIVMVISPMALKNIEVNEFWIFHPTIFHTFFRIRIIFIRKWPF